MKFKAGDQVKWIGADGQVGTGEVISISVTLGGTMVCVHGLTYAGKAWSPSFSSLFECDIGHLSFLDKPKRPKLVDTGTYTTLVYADGTPFSWDDGHVVHSKRN